MIAVSSIKNKSRMLTVAAAAALVVAVASTPARAEATAPWWSITSSARPTSLHHGGEGQIVMTAQNLGDASTSGKVTLIDQLPAGLEAIGITAVAGEDGSFNRGPVRCALKTLTCTFEEFERTNGKGEKEVIPETLPPYEEIEVRIAVDVNSSAASGELNTVNVSGGGAADTRTVSHPIEVGSQERFGFEEYSLIPENPGGSTDTQAGSHPFQLTSVLTLNSQAPDQAQSSASAMGLWSRPMAPGWNRLRMASPIQAKPATTA